MNINTPRITEFYFSDEEEAYEQLALQKQVVALTVVDEMRRTNGGIWSIVGPMESGKSTVGKMIQETVEGLAPEANIVWFKPEMRAENGDLICEDNVIHIREDGEIEGVLLKNWEQLYNLPTNSTVLIDEAEFLNADLLKFLLSTDWEKRGIKIVCLGLPEWHHGGKWESMQQIMNASKSVHWLNALSDEDDCLCVASKSQQTVNGINDPSGPDVAARDGEIACVRTAAYKAMCLKHFVGRPSQIDI